MMRMACGWVPRTRAKSARPLIFCMFDSATTTSTGCSLKRSTAFSAPQTKLIVQRDRMGSSRDSRLPKRLDRRLQT